MGSVPIYVPDPAFPHRLSVLHKPKALGSTSEGFTGFVRQGNANSRLELAFKKAKTLPDWLNEMVILARHPLRTHPFIATVEGLGWHV